MSCGPTACPPAGPTPEAAVTWTLPTPAACGLGTTYYNTPQTYVNTCPTGSPTPEIIITIPAYAYSSSTSQEDADDQAMAAAEAAADAARALSPCEDPGEDSFLLAENDDFLITEGGDFFIL